MTEFTWDRERHDFIDTFRKAGLHSFVVVNQSTGLMEDLHGYVVNADAGGRTCGAGGQQYVCYGNYRRSEYRLHR